MIGPDVEIHTPYGATEALPVACISSAEILSETRKLTEKGFGICVGRPVGDVEIRLIAISDEPIPEWRDDLIVEGPDIGEITVRGDLVSRGYYDRPRDNALAKIRDGEEIWHRMGDLGWMDSKGRIWFCGRKSHRVITEKGPMYTIPCEAVFNNHPAVYRSALVGVGRPPAQKPIICIELRPESAHLDKEEIKRELLNYAARNPMTENIQTILFHKGFPVDIRHNSKIFREKLALWAK
jgi:acyl-CoA synthetase (AMP-forming)/AMP-acid ligase II